jgi:hypothetical protein
MRAATVAATKRPSLSGKEQAEAHGKQVKCDQILGVQAETHDHTQCQPPALFACLL